MKKYILVFFITLSFLFTGCSNEKQQKSQLKSAAEDYYKTYMSGVKGINKAEISLEMLNKANDKDSKEYNLKALKNCKKDTKIIFTINDGKIASEEYKLSCK